MARTLIGELLLRMKDDTKSAEVAGNIERSMKRIEDATKRLNSAPWGGKFQSQLDKLNVGARDIDRLGESWKRLYADMSSRNLSKALQKSEISNWKTSVLGQFVQQQQALRNEMKKSETSAKSWKNSMNNIFKTGLVALGAYTGAYMGGVAIKGGLGASAEWEREKYRQTMASMSPQDRAKLNGNAIRLGSQYPSVNITDIAELGRGAVSTMGDTDKAMQILPDLVRGMVTLQSAKGTDVAVEEMRNLLRGIDNAGQNGGELGVQNTREIIAGMIRAAQIEGADLDVGKLYAFARRGKIAVPGLSPEFLSTTQPALSQDMTAEGFGTALSAAYSAFVIGSSSNSSKKNIAAQYDMGIRTDAGLVQDRLFGTDPYAWVKQVLMPALVKQGVDTSDDVGVGKAIAGLTRNTNASSLLTRMVTQSPQVDRLRQFYGNAMGPEAAEGARFSDPFVGWKSFMESLQNLAAAVGEDVMPTIVAGLNSLTDGINTLQGAWRDGSGLAKMGIAGAVGAGAYGGWKAVSGIWGLMTAGPALNAAALSLEGAAASIVAANGGSLASNVPGAATKGGGMWALLGKKLAVAGLAIGGVDALFRPGDGLVNADRRGGAWGVDDLIRWAMGTGGGNKKEPFQQPTRPGQQSSGPQVRMPGDIQTMMGFSADALQKSLSPEGKPTIDTSNIDAAISKAKELQRIIQATEVQTMMGGSINATNPARAMNRNMSDHGVVP